MLGRSDALQVFVEEAFKAFDHFARDGESRRSVRQIFALLKHLAGERTGLGSRLPVCLYLEDVLATAAASRDLRSLVDAFRIIEPMLAWSRQKDVAGSASANFADGHANAMIIGPNGLENRQDLWLGVSLLAPDVRYPDHNHAPEEVYLVLSDGDFQHGDSPWFSPGIGGSFYNKPGINHAMRSSNTPLLAFWALLADPRQA